MTRPSSAPRPFPPLPLLALFLAACGGGGGGAPPTATLSGRLRLPQAAPAQLQVAFDAERPMQPGEVVVWLEPGAAPPDLTADGLDLLRAPGGPIAVYRPRSAAGRSSIAEGAPLPDLKPSERPMPRRCAS